MDGWAMALKGEEEGKVEKLRGEGKVQVQEEKGRKW